MKNMSDTLNRLTLANPQTPPRARGATPVMQSPAVRSARKSRGKAARIHLAQIDRNEREDFTAQLEAVTSDNEDDELAARLDADGMDIRLQVVIGLRSAWDPASLVRGILLTSEESC